MAGRGRRVRGDRGASLIELALIAPVMVLIVMGVVDLTRAYRMQIRLENAAREGAAYVLREDPNRVSGCTGDDVADLVAAEEPDITTLPGYRVRVWTDTDGTQDMAVEITGCETSTAGQSGDRIRVDVHGTFDVLTPMVERIVGSTIDVTGSAMVEAH